MSDNNVTVVGNLARATPTTDSFSDAVLVIACFAVVFTITDEMARTERS